MSTALQIIDVLAKEKGEKPLTVPELNLSLCTVSNASIVVGIEQLLRDGMIYKTRKRGTPGTPTAYGLTETGWGQARAKRPPPKPAQSAARPATVSKPSAGALSAQRVSVVREVLAEVERAAKKFPTWPTDPLHALAVLAEEFGELSKAALQLTYEPEKSSADQVHQEAIQTAAMAVRFAMSLHRYKYERAAQHSQASDPANEEAFK